MLEEVLEVWEVWEEEDRRRVCHRTDPAFIRNPPRLRNIRDPLDRPRPDRPIRRLPPPRPDTRLNFSQTTRAHPARSRHLPRGERPHRRHKSTPITRGYLASPRDRLFRGLRAARVRGLSPGNAQTRTELIGKPQLQVRPPLVVKVAPQDAWPGIRTEPATRFQPAARSGRRRVPPCPSGRRPMLTVTPSPE